MSFEKTTCVLVICDGCGPDWWEDSDAMQPHFISAQAARKQLTEEGWRFTRQIDESLSMLCPECAGKQDCEERGHDWFRASADDERRLDPAVHLCSRCNKVRRDDEPPAGHPDSMDVELPAEQEALLAEIEAAVFPEDDDAFAAGIFQALPRLRENGGSR